MPKITIYEKDLTTAGSDTLSNNVAYIPGYAITGPINTPTLCQTLEQFQEIFGYLPYKFSSQQPYPDGYPKTDSANPTYANLYMYQSDDYELSYVYATELLKNGLSVLFERVVTANDDFIAKYTFNKGSADSLTVSAKYQGKYGTNLVIEQFSNINNTYYMTVRLKAASLGMPRDIVRNYTFSFNPQSNVYYKKIESTFDLINLTLTGSESTIVINETINKPDQYKTLAIASEDEEFTVNSFYSRLSGDLFTKLTDRNEYQIKFITAGGYPVFEYEELDKDQTKISITKIMLKAAATRGDAIALIDHTNLPNRILTGMSNDTSLYYSVNTKSLADEITITLNNDREEDARKYGAMFTPWATYESKVLGLNFILPASFAYLNSLAVSVKSNANWYAIAGVTRGLVPNLLQLSQNITGAMANDLQLEDGISINPITNIKPYGYCIWGNRTLNKNKGLVASSFLNIRALTSDVKKVVYTAAKKLTFELNSDVLWLNFKAEIEPTLDKMVSGNGLTNYKILRKASTKRATIEAVIRLYVVEAVEDWDITIELSDTTVSVQ